MWSFVVPNIEPTSGDTYRLLGSKCRRPGVMEDKPHDIVRGYYMSCMWRRFCGGGVGGMWRSFRCHDVTMATLGAIRGACERDKREEPTIYCTHLDSIPVSCRKTLSYKKLSWLCWVQIVIRLRIIVCCHQIYQVCLLRTGQFCITFAWPPVSSLTTLFFQ